MAVALARAPRRPARPALTLTPYQRGAFPRDGLAHLWSLMEAEGACARVFHSAVETPGAAYDTRGDLVDFVRMLEPPPPARTLTLIAAADGQVAGLVWFSDLVPGVRAAVNVWYRRRVWGAPARAATDAACRLAFAQLAIPALWAYTPWLPAVRHAEAVGFVRVAELPGYVRGADGLRPLWVLRRGA